jgi:predicted metal-binding transcription factor (methanogenesis marker protein 9)
MELLIKLEENSKSTDIINSLISFGKVKWIQKISKNKKVTKTIINNNDTISAMSVSSKKHLAKYVAEETEPLF